jgi:hypothetical protein
MQVPSLQPAATRALLQHRVGLPGVHLLTVPCGNSLFVVALSQSPFYASQLLLETDNGEFKLDVDPWRTNHHNYTVHCESWIWKAFED